MTLSDHMHPPDATCDHRNERVARGVGVALAKCLCQALEQGRLTAGIVSSAMLLQSAPERVLVCVLPDMGCVSDHALHIHHTLITAFCWEHGIRLLRVAGHDLKRALTRLTEDSRNSHDVRDHGMTGPCRRDNGVTSPAVRENGVIVSCVKDSGANCVCVKDNGVNCLCVRGNGVSCLCVKGNGVASLCVRENGKSSSCNGGSGSVDFSCVLIEHSSEGLSFEEEVVLGYHDDVMYSDVFPKPVLHLPG